MCSSRIPVALSAALFAGAFAFASYASAGDHPAAKAGSEHPAGKTAEHPGGGMDMPMPKSGPEHTHLMKCVGKWNATVKMMMAPGSDPMVMQGVEDVTSICNGMFIETVHKGAGPMPFEGHGITGYDQGKKKYTGVWVDSWGTGMMVSEGTSDAKGVMTCTATMADPTGKAKTCMMQESMPDNNTRIMKMWEGTDMSVPPMMEITYVRAMSGTESAHK